MIVNAGYRGKVGASAPKFTYTGNYNVRKDGVVELLTSGTIVFLEPKVIDVFMVGGGGHGADPTSITQAGYGGGGGGGGYTRTVRKLSVNGSYQVNIGQGATTTSTSLPPIYGGTTSFGESITATGGASGISSSGTNDFGAGRDGGSGGGGGVRANSDYGAGGSDGGKGEQGISGGTLNPAGGTGQGTTTREFGEITGKLYAGGGGGGRYIYGSVVVSPGGSGGGGTGAWSGAASGSQAASAGGANTGGGGGGGAYGGSAYKVTGGSGGSGIVCFRDAAPLPELAGTWVLNERLYAPESTLTFSGPFIWGTNPNCTAMEVNPASYLYVTIAGTKYTKYQFSNNQWLEATRKAIFPAGATASDEFHAWLASNATKQ